MEIKHLEYQKLSSIKWDGGISKEYYLYPNNTSYQNKDFLIRLSTATIDKKPATFTLIIGYTRYLMMLDKSLELKINGRDIIKKPFETIIFKSEDDVISNTTGIDYNLMLSEDIKEHHVSISNGFHMLDNHFIMVTSLNNCTIHINDIAYTLNQYDTIVIENFKNDDIDLITSDNIILATIDLLHTNKF
jgi:environmental stress-induced protein Ves